MTILHVVGKPRSGKGVLMTFLSLALADQGQLVDSNYHMDSPNCNFITFYDLLSFLKKPRVNPQHLLDIDELPGWCDSYVTQAKSSRFASHFLNQSAKLGYDMIFSSQRSMRADINFRELSDVRLKAEKCETGFIYHILDPEETEDDIDTGRTIKLPNELASQYWDRFDTWEAVPPIGLDEVLVEMQRFDPEKMNDFINRQCRVVCESYPNLVFSSTNAVAEVLLDVGESTRYAGLVYARLNRWRQQKPQQKEKTQTPHTAVQSSPLPQQSVWQRYRK